MASPISILKSVLDLNHTVIESQEILNCTVHKYGETHDQQQLLVHCRPFKKLQGRCPFCMNKCPGYDTKRSIESCWRAPDLNGVPVYLCYCPRRIKCEKHGVLTEYIPWADGSGRFTEDFNNEVAWLVTQMSKTAIADFLGINWRTVGNCLKAAHNRLEPDVSERLHGLRRICVDETSYSKGHRYITVVYDMERNRVVWVCENHGLSVFSVFCELLTPEERAKIEVVAGDGARWIDACVRKYFPNATRCVDPFHVVEWTNVALDQVRANTLAKATRDYNRQKKEFQKAEELAAKADAAAEAFLHSAEQELDSMPRRRGRPSQRKQMLQAIIADIRLNLESSRAEQVPRGKGRPRKETFSPEHQQALDDLAAQAKSVKGSKHALGHKPENRTENQNEQIRLIESRYPDLYKAFQLKETLRLILHMRDAGQAREELIRWKKDAEESGFKPMQDLAEKINRHTENILNSIAFQANSAKSESVNTSIKVLIRMARGFHDVGNMIALIYLKCSDLIVPLHNRIQPSPEILKQRRDRANERRRAREEARRLQAATT